MEHKLEWLSEEEGRIVFSEEEKDFFTAEFFLTGEEIFHNTGFEECRREPIPKCSIVSALQRILIEAIDGKIHRIP